MRLHGNARTCLHSRWLIVERVLEQCWTIAAAAEAAGVSERTAAKWLARYRAEGRDGLRDRSSAPKRVAARTPAERVRVIELLRRLRMTAAEIAEVLRMPLSTVSAVLKRIGLGKRSRLERRSRPTATSALGQASSCTSTSKSSPASTAPAIACSAAGPVALRPPLATSTCTSASTTTAVSPTLSCSATSGQPAASPSCAGRSASSQLGVCAASAS
jgi:transposase